MGHRKVSHDTENFSVNWEYRPDCNFQFISSVDRALPYPRFVLCKVDKI